MSDSESEGDYAGPAPPPALAAKPKAAEEEQKKTTFIGPMIPSSTTSTAPVGPSLPGREEDSDDDDEDEDIGPAPLPDEYLSKQDANQEGVLEFLEQEENRRIAREEALKPKKQERDEWMLVPPKNMGMTGPGDTTKIKARGFRQDSSSTLGNSSGMNLWTETPAERAKRLDDEMLGKRAPASKDDGGDAAEIAERERKRKRDQENSRAIEEYNKMHRPKSLLEAHQSKLDEEKKEKKKKKKDREKEKDRDRKDKKSRSDKDREKEREKERKKRHKSKYSDDEEDDRPPPIWDHQRDMGMGGSNRLMSEKQRTSFINEAKGLASRFTSGKSR